MEMLHKPTTQLPTKCIGFMSLVVKDAVVLSLNIFMLVLQGKVT